LDINPYVMVVQSSSPHKTLKDLADAVKANPGKLKYSHSGTATILSLGPQMLTFEMGLPTNAVVGIPFTSDGDSKVALMGGNVDFLGVNLTGVIDQIKAGTLRALAVSTNERLKDLPDVPTFKEAGFPSLMSISGWSGLYGPKNLPEEVVKAWVAVIKKVAADQDWRKATLSLGNVPVMNSPAEAKDFVKGQIELFRKIYASSR
jgi:tripartite-type tricarboxylate transporter receptor subunit TctC